MGLAAGVHCGGGVFPGGQEALAGGGHVPGSVVGGGAARSAGELFEVLAVAVKTPMDECIPTLSQKARQGWGNHDFLMRERMGQPRACGVNEWDGDLSSTMQCPRYRAQNGPPG